jgi:hypothetical protein
MGQYHYVVNLDKKQYLHPHRFDDGLKLLEFGCSSDGTLTALAILLAAQVRGGARGGGDASSDQDSDPGGLVGSWAGDRIVIAGDYAEPSDAQGWDAEHNCSLYETCGEEYQEMSAPLLVVMAANDAGRAGGVRPTLRPDMVINLGREET